MDTDSEQEMDQAIEVLAIEDEVRKQPALFSEHPEITAKSALFSDRTEKQAKLLAHTNAMISSRKNTSNKKEGY